MKNNFFGFIAAFSMLVASCSTQQKIVMTYTPEENGISLVKITNESNNQVLAKSLYSNGYTGTFATSNLGGNKEAGLYWNTSRVLDVSPDGEHLAFLSYVDYKCNVMTHKATTGGASSPRTYSNVNSVSWGYDGNIYYGNLNDDVNAGQICSVNAQAGRAIRKLTFGANDFDPVVTRDGKMMFFTRMEGIYGCSVYSYNLENGQLSVCANGYNPTIVGRSHDSFVCVRNSPNGNSELYYINYVMNREECILSDKEHSFTNPCVSPDGKWVVCVGNSKSNINRKKNLDIYAVRIDGSELMQLTFHPSDDFCPIWSPDGKYIYFVSSRANKNNRYNVWRMNFAH